MNNKKQQISSEDKSTKNTKENEVKEQSKNSTNDENYNNGFSPTKNNQKNKTTNNNNTSNRVDVEDENNENVEAESQEENIENANNNQLPAVENNPVNPNSRRRRKKKCNNPEPSQPTNSNPQALEQKCSIERQERPITDQPRPNQIPIISRQEMERRILVSMCERLNLDIEGKNEPKVPPYRQGRVRPSKEHKEKKLRQLDPESYASREVHFDNIVNMVGLRAHLGLGEYPNDSRVRSTGDLVDHVSNALIHRRISESSVGQSESSNRRKKENPPVQLTKTIESLIITNTKFKIDDQQPGPSGLQNLTKNNQPTGSNDSSDDDDDDNNNPSYKTTAL